VDLAREQQHPGFALAFTRLRDAGELKTLTEFWKEQGLTAKLSPVLERTHGEVAQAPAARRKKAAGTSAAAILLLVGLLIGPSTTLAGDGKELSATRSSATRSTPTGRAAVPARAGAMTVPTRSPVGTLNIGRVSNAPGRTSGGAMADAQRPSIFPAPLPRAMYEGTAPAGPAPRRLFSGRSIAGRREVVRRSATQERVALMRALAQEAKAARARSEGEDPEASVPTLDTATTGSRVEDNDLTRLPVRIEDKAVVMVAEGPAPDETPQRRPAQ
jgi:hypothetical protein